MRAGQVFRAISLAGVLLVPVACDQLPGGGLGGDSATFRAQYSTARTALEGGGYARAQRIYKQLLPQAGPLTPRIQLEYAHALLRDGKYEDASGQAQTLATTQKGAARAAALAVLGTAQHELALAAIDRGEADGAGRYHLISARDAIAEVLKSHKDLDPLGGLALRQRSIKAML